MVQPDRSRRICPHGSIDPRRTWPSAVRKHPPLKDGNGRLGRALAEKSLAQNIGQPSLIALAYTIERERKTYYDQLETHQKALDVTPWLLWFGETRRRRRQRRAADCIQNPDAADLQRRFLPQLTCR